MQPAFTGYFANSCINTWLTFPHLGLNYLVLRQVLLGPLTYEDVYIFFVFTTNRKSVETSCCISFRWRLKMKKFIVFISLFSLLLSMVAVWYFGYFYPAQKKNATPTIIVEKQLPITTPGVSPQKPFIREDAVGVSKKDSVLTPTNRNTEINTQENTDIAVESSPNDVGTVPPDEHTAREHNNSSEESAAEKTEFETLMKEILLEREEREVSHERTQNTKNRAFPKMINMLTLKSPEEQRAVLMLTKDWLYNEFPTSPEGAYLLELSSLLPDFNIEDGLKLTWNTILTELVKYGYTLPAGIEKE